MSKQKADRKQVVQPPPPPVQNTEIVPGRLSEQCWLETDEILENEEIACEIVEEVLRIILKKAYSVYLKQQLLPYTVSAAKDALLLVVEWNFLDRDESQCSPVLQPGWTPDTDPERPLIDNWAPGYFIAPDEKSVEELVEEQSESKSQEDKELMQHPSKTKQSPYKPQRAATFPQITPISKAEDEPLLSQEICFLLESDVTESKVPKIEKEKKEKKEKPKKFLKPKLAKSKQQSHLELLQKASVSRMSETLSQTEREEYQKHEECLHKHDFVHTQEASANPSQFNLNQPPNNRVQANKDIIYDKEGKMIGVAKLNPDKLPSNRVKIDYHLPDRDSSQVKADKKRVRYKDNTSRNVVQSSFPRHPLGRTHKKTFAIESDELCAPPLKSMVEAIEPVVGVTIRDAHQVKTGPNPQGPTRQLLTECADELRPITRKVPIPTTDLLEILQPTTTVLSQGRSSPLPPINQNSPPPTR